MIASDNKNGFGAAGAAARFFRRPRNLPAPDSSVRVRSGRVMPPPRPDPRATPWGPPPCQRIQSQKTRTVGTIPRSDRPPPYFNTTYH